MDAPLALSGFILSWTEMTNTASSMRPPMSGNASRKTKFRTLSKSVLRKYHTHANAVMP